MTNQQMLQLKEAGYSPNDLGIWQKITTSNGAAFKCVASLNANGTLNISVVKLGDMLEPMTAVTTTAPDERLVIPADLVDTAPINVSASKK